LLSAEFLDGVVDAFKIASGDNTFTPLIRRVTQFDKPLLIATGVSCSEDVHRLFSFVADAWSTHDVRERLGLLHCVSSYPTPAEDANLRAIEYLSQHYPCTIGYSDHTLGIHAASLAVALGARVIEKHFTLDKQYSDFRDHQLSADPREMRQLVENVKLAARMLGDSAKAIQPSEEACRTAIRRSIVMSRDAAAGHRLSAGDITWLRPGGGLPPGREHLLIGRTLSRPLQFGDPITLADVA
jgi:sialic acid synthase SpsE